MKKRFRTILTGLLAVSMLFTLCACGGGQQDSNTDGDQAEGAVRTITDITGREVEIPVEVNTIVPLGNAPRMVSHLGLADKVVAVEECEHAESPIMAYAYVNIDQWKDLPNVGTSSLGATEWYAEELVTCNPDVIICTYTSDVADDVQRQTGIPTVAVTSPALFSEEYNECLRMVADVCGVPEKAEELISYTKACLEDLENRTKDIPDEDKPTVLAAGATFSGGHSIDGVYANYPVFKVLSANDVAIGISEKTGGLLVDKEQILEWNPEMIFFDSNSMALVNADYAADPSYFEQLQAVQNGQLYQWPNSTWHWSNIEIPLVTAYYVGIMLYPEAFADVDFEEKAAEIFEMFLGEPDYLEVLEEAGAGYTKITLGE